MSNFTNTTKHSASTSNASKHSASMAGVSKTTYPEFLIIDGGSLFILTESGLDLLLEQELGQSYANQTKN